MRPFRFAIVATFCLLAFAGCSVLSPVPPEKPVGQAVCVAGRPCVFSGLTRDRQNDSIAYRFDWGDGSLSDWTGLVPSGSLAAAVHVWDRPGEYLVRVRARDKSGLASVWSLKHRLTIVAYSGYPDSVLKTIGAGDDPVGIAAEPHGQRVFVVARGDNELRVIRTSDDSVLARVGVGIAPHAVCVLPDGRYAYVANSRSENVSVVRLSDYSLVGTVPVGSFPIYCTASPNSRAVYVSNYGSGTVSVIRTSDNKVAATIDIGEVPWGIAVLPSGEYAYVALSGEGKLKVVRLADNKVVGEVRVHSAPEGLAVLPGGDYVYAACRSPNSGSVDVVRVSDDSLVASIPVSGYPVSVAPLSSGEYVYVACHVSGDIHVVSTQTNTVVRSFSGARGPCYGTVLPDGSRAYFCANFEDRLWVVGRAAQSVKANPAGRE